MTATYEVRTALAVYGAHTWNATTRLCECGESFNATLAGHKLHDEHRMAKVLEAVSGSSPSLAEAPEPSKVMTTVEVKSIDIAYSRVQIDKNGNEVFSGGWQTLRPKDGTIDAAIALLEGLR